MMVEQINSEARTIEEEFYLLVRNEVEKYGQALRDAGLHVDLGRSHTSPW